jgi:signal peptidase I
MSVVALVVLILACGALIAARRRFLVVTVRGTSMMPTLRPGERLLARRTGIGSIERGAIVVVRLDAPDFYVKRVTAVAGDPVPDGVPAATATVPDRMVVLRGDNHHSLDSRVWGCVPVDRIVGVRMREMAR